MSRTQDFLADEGMDTCYLADLASTTYVEGTLGAPVIRSGVRRLIETMDSSRLSDFLTSQDDQGKTPLHVCVGERDFDGARTIITSGGDLEARTSDGKGVWHFLGSKRISPRKTKYSSDWERDDWALAKNSLEVIIDQKAPLTSWTTLFGTPKHDKDNLGRCPCDFAVRTQHHEFLDLISELDRPVFGINHSAQHIHDLFVAAGRVPRKGTSNSHLWIDPLFDLGRDFSDRQKADIITCSFLSDGASLGSKKLIGRLLSEKSSESIPDSVRHWALSKMKNNPQARLGEITPHEEERIISMTHEVYAFSGVILDFSFMGNHRIVAAAEKLSLLSKHSSSEGTARKNEGL